MPTASKPRARASALIASAIDMISRLLKKSLFSPAQPRRAETRLFPCFVLASFRPSTLRRISRRSESLKGLFRSPRSITGRTAHTKCGLYLLGPSLAAALLDGLFEHPARVFFCCARRDNIVSSRRLARLLGTVEADAKLDRTIVGFTAGAGAGDLGFPVCGVVVESTECISTLGDGRPGLVGSGDIGHEAACGEGDATALRCFSLCHTETAGLFCRGV